MQNKRFEHFFLLHHHASRLDLAHSKLELVSNITTIENGAKGVSLLLFIPTPKGLRNVNKDDFPRVFLWIYLKKYQNEFLLFWSTKPARWLSKWAKFCFDLTFMTHRNMPQGSDPILVFFEKIDFFQQIYYLSTLHATTYHYWTVESTSFCFRFQRKRRKIEHYLPMK